MMICPRTGDVCKCGDQEICTLDIAFINLGSPADAPVSIESSVEPSVSGMAMMVNRADEFAAMARDAERWKYARTLADGKHKDGGSWIEIILPWPNGTYHRTEDCADASVDAALARSPVEPVSDHDKIVSWNWVLRSIENNPDHAVIISRTPDGLCFMHGNPVPELESANELLRDALKELVELKDMKEILDANESTPLKVWSIEEEYRERKPKAWALARAVLNDTNPVMDAAPACERKE